MAVYADLKFDGGHLGFKRCQDAEGKPYIRAFVHFYSRGISASAAVEVDDVMAFCFDAVKQCAFASGYSEVDLINIGLEKIVGDLLEEKESGDG